MDVVHVRVANALNGQELLAPTAFSCSELQEQVLTALGSRPSRQLVLLRDGAVVDELRASPGDRIEVTAVVKDALSVDEQERHVQQLQSAGLRLGRRTFQAFSKAARDDATVVLAAVRADARCLHDATEMCKSDPAIVREAVGAAVQQNVDVLQLPGIRRDDAEMMLVAVRQHPCNLQYAAPVCKENREIVLAAVLQDGRALQHAARTCREDKDIVLAAVQQNSRAFAWAGRSCERDEDIRRAARL